jgi:hypothetical protein
MKQRSFCTYCNKTVTFEPVQVSGFIHKAIEGKPGVIRQTKYLLNFLFLENVLAKNFTAYQCNHCGDVYNRVPDTGRYLLYIDYRNENAIICKVLAEYDNRQYVVEWLEGHEIIVSPDEDMNWFDDQQTAIEAYSYWLEAQGKPIGKHIQHILKVLGGI